MGQLTSAERTRIAEIRRSLNRFKRLGKNVKTWEASFFLGILDRLLNGKEK